MGMVSERLSNEKWEKKHSRQGIQQQHTKFQAENRVKFGNAIFPKAIAIANPHVKSKPKNIELSPIGLTFSPCLTYEKNSLSCQTSYFPLFSSLHPNFLMKSVVSYRLFMSVFIIS